jgi:dihydrofolate reductase
MLVTGGLQPDRRPGIHHGAQHLLARARAAAGDGDVSVHGGATTINQYLAAGLIDELRLHIVPLTLGAGTRLFDGVPALKLEQAASRAATSVTHLTYHVLSGGRT